MFISVDGKGEKGAMGVEQWTKNEEVDSQHGASKGGSSQLQTKSHHSK
jgi:hypothetical protein